MLLFNAMILNIESQNLIFNCCLLLIIWFLFVICHF